MGIEMLGGGYGSRAADRDVGLDQVFSPDGLPSV